MAIIVHPLTQLNGSPKYTAEDFRKTVNGLILPSDSTTYGTISGVRAGSPSPLTSMVGNDITVAAHAGVVNPWHNVGAYSYYLTEDVTVTLPTSSNYYVVVTVGDPSQSHGLLPEGRIELIAAADYQRDSLSGLVLGTTNGVSVSDIAPRLQPQTKVLISSSTELDYITAVDGQEATVTSGAGAGDYIYQSGK